ncbi:hypothetical protein K504DRAFT_207008 [Pleomassaria siparia CBS 279.74]|uniref:Uncharacterized protein n=1 Tax=Pleomassaria siparia CBS 279.74 TaxID=1314801 RepID=A0A6G1KJK3_9PLEO|nr:hypothetical protein K504DRAFT_207008 [Pleomassaria siparia CBS 279.74]
MNNALAGGLSYHSPLSAAFRWSELFQGSRVVTMDAACSSFTASPSICTAGHVEVYLTMGIPREVGTICRIDIVAKDFFAPMPIVQRRVLSAVFRLYSMGNPGV